MFPGCTITDMRLKQEQLWSEGGYEPWRRQRGGAWFMDRRLRLDHVFTQIITSLLAAFGL